MLENNWLGLFFWLNYQKVYSDKIVWKMKNMKIHKFSWIDIDKYIHCMSILYLSKPVYNAKK